MNWKNIFKDLMSPDGGSIFHRSSIALSLQSEEIFTFQVLYWEYTQISCKICYLCIISLNECKKVEMFVILLLKWRLRHTNNTEQPKSSSKSAVQLLLK